MRDFYAVNSNVSLSKDADDRWRPTAEVIILASEPQYHLDEDYELKKRRRELEQFRFVTTEDGLATLIEGLEKLRFEMQSAETSTNLANRDAPAPKERKAA